MLERVLSAALTSGGDMAEVFAEDAVTALGAVTGMQAVQQVRAGLKAIYLSGWQVAADANLAGQTYPDQSLYPVNSVPQVVRRINNALLRADQISWSESADGDIRSSPYWLAPIVADASTAKQADSRMGSLRILLSRRGAHQGSRDGQVPRRHAVTGGQPTF